MTRARSGVTLILGPQSRVGMALNDIARSHRTSIENEGIRVLPSRIATRQLRAGMRGAPIIDVLDVLLGGRTAEAPTVLSAINILGRPASAILNDELFPEAERRLNGAANILGQECPRIVLAPEALVDLVLRTGSPQLESRVRGMKWDVLYELSWPDLVDEVLDAFPSSQVTLVIPDAALLRPGDVLKAVFGCSRNLQHRPLQDAVLSPQGIEALDALTASGKARDQSLKQLVRTHNSRPDPDTVRDRLGLDRVTQDLLDQRFSEDVAALRSLDRVTVV